MMGNQLANMAADIAGRQPPDGDPSARHTSPPARLAGRYENDRSCEGAYCSEAGDLPRALPTWGAGSSRPHRGAQRLFRRATARGHRVAMDLIAVGEGSGTQLAAARLEVDVLRGAQGLQDGIKTLPRP